MINLQTVYQTILPIIQQASTMLREAFEQEQVVLTKVDEDGMKAVVTDTDKKLDAFLRKELTNLYPDFGFITEENSSTNLKEYNWIIDPVDGTFNFSQHIPLFGISIALWHGDEPVYGVFSFPMEQIILHGTKNQGVTLNNKQISQVDHSNSERIIVGYAFGGKGEKNVELYQALKSVTSQAYSRFSAVYEAYLLLTGRTNAVAYVNLSLWDLGAAVFLAEEAGYSVKYISPKPDLTAKTNLRGYIHSVVFGEEKVVEKIVVALSPILKS